MPVLTPNRDFSTEAIADWEAHGDPRREEIWEGVSVIMPEADNEHQELAAFFIGVFFQVFASRKLGKVNINPNITNSKQNWTKNYRLPDMAYFSHETKAEDRKTHWLGGPDFLLEVVSPDDLSRDKLDFYSEVGTREVLILDRDPWKLELYQLRDGKLVLAHELFPTADSEIESSVVPLTFALRPGSDRPEVSIRHRGTGETWSV